MTTPADPAASAPADDTSSASAQTTLRWNDPLAVEATAAVQRGQADRLRRLLDKHPGLARVRVVKDGEAAGQRTLLHLFADWPGHRRNPQQIVAVLVAAGADPDAPGIPTGPGAPWIQGDQSQETPLHWAASNDDVELVDALLDAGADVNVPGSIIGGLGSIADAAVFGGQRACRRLVERGARTNLYQAAALGLTDRVRTRLEAEIPPRPGADHHRLLGRLRRRPPRRRQSPPSRRSGHQLAWLEQPDPARRRPLRRRHRPSRLARSPRRPPRPERLLTDPRSALEPVAYAIDRHRDLSPTPSTPIGDVNGVVDSSAILSPTPSTRI